MLVESRIVGAVLATAALSLAVWLRPSDTPEVERAEITIDSRTPITPLEAPPGLAADEVALGRRLFHEKALSRDWSVSCATCHPLAMGGADRRARSVGVGGAVGLRNTPTVYNSGLNPYQFWDGRATSLEEQVSGPLLGEHEMASSWALALARIEADDGLARAFRAVYGGEATRERVRHALATYERSLVTVNSPFDRSLRGEAGAISAEAQRGYELFVSLGCASCHQGANVGGNLFQVYGAVGERGLMGAATAGNDLGRFNVTGREEDRHVFRVPSLRLAALTPPYLHDGSVQTLDEAIALMGRLQLGRELAAADRAAIAAFLGSLVGTLDPGEAPDAP